MRRDSDSFYPSLAQRRSSHSPNRFVLLYVEDDDDNWDVAELRLSDNFELIRAKDDREACRALRERGEEIDAILMDIELRGSELNGAELTELLRGNPAPTARSIPPYARDLPTISKPVLFVTANGTRYSDVQLMLFGADRVVAKPINVPVLERALLDLLGSQRTSQPRPSLANGARGRR